MKKLLILMAFVLLMSPVAHASMIPVNLTGIGPAEDYVFLKSWNFVKDTLTGFYKARESLRNPVKNLRLQILVPHSSLTMDLSSASSKTLTKGGGTRISTLSAADGKELEVEGRTQTYSHLPFFSMGILLVFSFLGLALLGFRRKRV
jgi:hypothetical protein